MDKGKISTIIVLCLIAGMGIFFAFRYFYDSKREVGVSVIELNNEKQLEKSEVAEEKKEIIGGVENSQAPVVKDSGEKIVEKKQDTSKPKEVAPVEDKKVSSETNKKIVDKLVSWGYTKSSDRKIDTIIVHSSYNSLGGDVYDADKIIAIYKQYEVAAHYLIARDGTAYRLVDEKNVAWHAGVSKVPDGRTNVNDFSIGIEMINTQDGKYTDQQYDALNSLIKNLKSKYTIKYILGHNEIAPGRKTDPWGISWNKVNR